MFRTEEQVAQFSREFDGHVFKDKQGELSYPSPKSCQVKKGLGRESRAIVEFAPFQKVPPLPERMKPDSRAGTLEKGMFAMLRSTLIQTLFLDEEYTAFIASLNSPPVAPSETVEAPGMHYNRQLTTSPHIFHSTYARFEDDSIIRIIACRENNP